MTSSAAILKRLMRANHCARRHETRIQGRMEEIQGSSKQEDALSAHVDHIVSEEQPAE